MAEPEVVPLTLVNLLDRLRQEQTAGFAVLGEKLDGKADKADVESIRADLRAINDRTTEIEQWRANTEGEAAGSEKREKTSVERRQRWATAAMGVVSLILFAVSVAVSIIR